jgi:hypothetical protein
MHVENLYICTWLLHAVAEQNCKKKKKNVFIWKTASIYDYDIETVGPKQSD